MSVLQQLQTLLRDLFQLDLADLAFGIYRLFRTKRDEIEAFLEEQLPRRVGEAFQAVAGEERAVLERELAELAAHARQISAATPARWRSIWLAPNRITR
jgi:adenine-specific DNA-methyltransferase